MQVSGALHSIEKSRVMNIYVLLMYFCLKAPQFVDIHLAEEDSSDEEYHPEDDEEDETAEDVRPDHKHVIHV